MLVFKITQLLNRKEGAQETHELDEAVPFVQDEEYTPVSRCTGTVLFMRLPNEISVQLSSASVDVECTCSRCLKRHVRIVTIPRAEREFLIDVPPEEMTEGEDNFFVDTHNRSIDITEMLRQEILLHFPEKAVCCEGCKGLCDGCGKDLNDGPCSCVKIDKDDDAKPLKNLKKLLQ
ncbi:MAG: hypothetical protein UY05_C0005G0007 [Candidatus Peregrinibacteria bacterium GW2011_GWA2_47_7]|nr:MAG: hypothetical protein UY05_C0005G0007 [Candidatus Peregrinibacteria bacterium GW2011_GWA2_47_7]